MPLIAVKDLTKVYHQGTDIELSVLKGINLDIEEGEFVAIMGPSGSGKSTLMHIIGFLDTPTDGSYTFDGTEVSSLDENELARIRNKETGFVFQAFHLLPRTTAMENVQLPLMYAGTPNEEQNERATDALTRVGLGERLDHTPNQLSGGQQQRVSIARALINRPKVIFADEPTGNLDSVSSNEIMALFSELHDEGNTLIMVTHEEDIAAYASRVIRLNDGMIVSDERQTPRRP